jgi:hypothetical protein
LFSLYLTKGSFGSPQLRHLPPLVGELCSSSNQ